MLKTTLKFLSVFLFLGASAAYAGEAITYKDGEVVLEGYVAHPDTEEFSGERPGILIVHQWKGLGEYEKKRADMLTDLGYVAFAIDMYGEGIRPTTMKGASSESSKYKSNPELARTRLHAALNQALTLPNIDKDNIAIIGYCFGGTMALELARSGANINAAVSFHGGLATKKNAESEKLKATIQVHHGADDPYVSAEEVTKFKAEMNEANADWHFISYADAVHSFTEKQAGDDPSKGVAYNEKADQRSWAYTLTLFEQVFE